MHAVLLLPEWLRLGRDAGQTWMLSLREGSVALGSQPASDQPVTFLSGPEGGLTAEEENAAQAAGFQAVSLGPRILRAETAALAALSAMTSLN